MLVGWTCSELTLADLTTLRNKARVLSRGNTYCRVLYRNKSPQYFSHVFTENAGVMKVYVKDNSGDQASPINGQINGKYRLGASTVYIGACNCLRALVQCSSRKRNDCRLG